MKNNTKVALIFIGLFLFTLLQIHFVWLSYDDYGYASLGYLPKYTGNIGLNTNLQDIFSFLSFHYNTWGGRVLWFFLEIILLRINIHAYRIVQAIFTTLIFFMIYKIIKKITKNDSWRLALSSALCFGLVDLMILRDTFYWFTASTLYLLPILPILILVYYTIDKKRSVLINIICILLAFISAWSQEQVSIYIVSYLGLITFHRIFIEKERYNWDIAITISSIIGFLILMLAPGSGVRMDVNTDFYSLSIIHKVLRNLPQIIGTNFGSSTGIYTFMFFSVVTYIFYRNKKNFKNKWIIDLALINTILIIIGNQFFDGGYFNRLFSIETGSIIVRLGIYAQVFYIAFVLFLCFYKNKEYTLAALLISALLSQVAMVMAPYFPTRSLTMLMFTTYIIFVYSISNIMKDKKVNIKVLLIPIVLISLFNYSSNTYGYYKNNNIKKENDKLLREASKKIKAGEDITEIPLTRIDELYGVHEPDDTYYLMRTYYDIPDYVDIHYVN